MPTIDPNTIGQDRANQTVEEATEKAHGKYVDPVTPAKITMPVEQRYADPVESIPQKDLVSSMPKGKDPTPFVLRSKLSGGR